MVKHSQFSQGYDAALADLFALIRHQTNDTVAVDDVLRWIGDNTNDDDTRQAHAVLHSREVRRVVATWGPSES